MFLFHSFDPILPTFLHKPKHCEKTHNNLYNKGMRLPQKFQYEMVPILCFLNGPYHGDFKVTICKLDPSN
jgi:hypothetical protein